VAVQKVDDGAVNLERHAVAKTTSAKHVSSICGLPFPLRRAPSVMVEYM
jgi:hypothetical protein